MRKLFFVIYFFIPGFLSLCQTGFGQNAEKKSPSSIDSLKNVLTSLADDTIRVSVLNQLSFEFTSNDSLNALRYARESLLLSRKLNFKKGEADALKRIGLAYERQTMYDSAFKYYFLANRLYIKIDNVYNTAVSYRSLGILHGKAGMYDSAAYYFYKSIDIAVKSNNKELQETNLNNLSLVYKLQEKYDEAIKYGLISYQISLERGNKISGALSLDNIGTYYLLKNQLDSAEYYLFKARLILSDSKRELDKAPNLENIASLKLQQGKLREATEYANKALEIFTQFPNKREKAKTYQLLADIYIDSNVIELAEQYTLKSLEICLQTKEKKIELDNYNKLEKIYAIKQNYKFSYDYLKKADKLQDSIFNENKSKIIDDLKLKYETEKKDRNIDQLENQARFDQLTIKQKDAKLRTSQYESVNKQKELELLHRSDEIKSLLLVKAKDDLQKSGLEAETKTTALKLSENQTALQSREIQRQKFIRNSVIIFSILLVLLGVLLINRFQLRKKLEKQQALIEERKRISLDMHDDIGSRLSEISLLSDVLKMQSNSGVIKQDLEKISFSAKSSLEKLSEIIWTLNPKNDKLGNMVSYIRKYTVEYLEPTQINCIVRIEDPLPEIFLSGIQRNNIFLCIKEALHNVVKHSGAKNVEFSCHNKNNKFEFIIRDDGKGVKLNPELGFGNGLQNMKFRMEIIGAEFIIENEIGTTIKLIIPVS